MWFKVNSKDLDALRERKDKELATTEAIIQKQHLEIVTKNQTIANLEHKLAAANKHIENLQTSNRNERMYTKYYKEKSQSGTNVMSRAELFRNQNWI